MNIFDFRKRATSLKNSKPCAQHIFRQPKDIGVVLLILKSLKLCVHLFSITFNLSSQVVKRKNPPSNW